MHWAHETTEDFQPTVHFDPADPLTVITTEAALQAQFGLKTPPPVYGRRRWWSQLLNRFKSQSTEHRQP